jgi:AraC-like DNA-binding protein
MSNPDRIPVFDLNTECRDAEERLARWTSFNYPFLDMAPLNWKDAGGLLHFRAWPTERAVFTDAHIEPHISERQACHIVNFDKPTLLVRMHAAGCRSTVIGSDAYTTHPGDLNVLDFSKTFTSLATRARVFMLIVAHEEVGYDPTQHPEHLRLQPNGPQGARLASSFLRLMRGLPVFSVADANAAIDQFLALFSQALADNRTSHVELPDPNIQRQSEMRFFIENSLQSLDLSPTAVADEFAVSRATIYRDLDSLGGLQRYVTRRRLEEACKELAFGPNDRGVVAAAAERWHFNSTAHFSRQFRRQFGFSPSKAVDCALFRMQPNNVQTGPDVERLTEWFERL